MARPTAPETIVRDESRPGKTGAFDLLIGGERLGHLIYSLPDKATLTIDYVEVDPSLRGKGTGQKLVAAAVEFARAHSRQVIPHCSYARSVMARTAAFQDVLAKR
jgi:predicted GNAT family acetyltransferase